MGAGLYILDKDGNPVEEPDVAKWGKWMQDNDRSIAQTGVGEAHVSTVFLGIDHSFRRGKPILFETMIFSGPHDMYQDRYYTKEQALIGHQRAIRIAEGKEEE